jgi:hypothetical protein
MDIVLPKIKVVDTTKVKAVVSIIANFSGSVIMLLNLRTRPNAMAPLIKPA